MLLIRDFNPCDALNVNALALGAFEQYKDMCNDWPAFQSKIANMSSLANVGEIIVAEISGQLVGAVVYIGPNVQKADFFQQEWPIMRMLVVAQVSRGLGIGRALTQECLCRGKRDGASIFALHTSKMMKVALSMYQKMGFKWASRAPAICGIEYDVYAKTLD